MYKKYKKKYIKYKKKYIINKIKTNLVLTPDSIIIIDFLTKLDYDLNYNPSSIDILFGKFKSYYDNITSYTYTPSNYNVKKYYFDIDSIFVDTIIKSDLSNIQNLKTTCYKYDKYETLIQTNYTLNNRFIRMLFSIILMGNENKKIHNHKYIIGLFPSKIKKKFPDIPKQEITPFNINSGYTLPYKYSIMFRNEEIIKVTIHELLHQLGVNLNIIIEKDSIDNFFKYKKNGDILLDEAYVEFYACILNILYISTIYKLDKQYIIYLFKLELKFSILQIAKLLLHFNIYDYNEFFPKCYISDNNNCISNKVNIEPNYMSAHITHPESYIIIKTAFLYYIDETLEIFAKNGKNIFNYNNNILDKQHIMKYILDICGRKEFINSINLMIQIYKNMNFNNIDNIIKNNCRLTCVETII
jgi:hypothetical protein